jgi:hypothetical protein
MYREVWYRAIEPRSKTWRREGSRALTRVKKYEVGVADLQLI